MLCLLGHGFHRNTLCNSPILQATTLSLLPESYHNISPESLSLASLARLVKWFSSKYSIKGDLDPGYSDLEMTLVSRLESHTVCDMAELVFLFIAMCRVMRLDTRLVTSLQPASHRAQDLVCGLQYNPDYLYSQI